MGTFQHVPPTDTADLSRYLSVRALIPALLAVPMASTGRARMLVRVGMPIDTSPSTAVTPTMAAYTTSDTEGSGDSVKPTLAPTSGRRAADDGLGGRPKVPAAG